MRPLHIGYALAAIMLGGASAQATAQVSPAPSPAVEDPARKAPDRKSMDKKAAEKKAAEKAAPPKAPPKAAPNPPAKAPPKAEAPKQATKVYTTGPSVLRDKQGNVIPTNPDAYNVDSALPKK